MSATFDPKEQFVKFHKDECVRLREEHQMPWFVIAQSYALTNMAVRGASAGQISGAKSFIQELNNLAADKDTVTTFPQKRLDSFDKPIEELIKAKE